MHCYELTHDQALTLYVPVERHRRYLERLHARMVAAGFPPDDPLRRAVRANLLATRALVIELMGNFHKGHHRRLAKRVRTWTRV